MMYDIILENGILIEPGSSENKKGSIYIKNNKIVSCENKEEAKAKQRIDVKGCYVFPGLIENHTHIYQGGSDTGLNGDVIMLPSGVTSAVDQGSAGWSNFELFYKSVIINSLMDVKCYLNIANTGLTTEDYFERIDPRYINEEKVKETYFKYQDNIIGLKIRLCKDSILDMGLKPLENAIRIAEDLDTSLSVHVKNIEGLNDIASLLRKDDVWVHMYEVKGETILDDNNKIRKEIKKAKDRGVLFDVASGRSGFSFDIIKKAIDEGFKPDLLGTDLVTYNVYERPIFSLPYLMSMYLNLGFTINEIGDMCIKTPAKVMGESGNLDTLKRNTQADIGVFHLKESPVTFKDRHGGVLRGDKLLVPKMTIKNGKVLYRSIEL